MAKTFVSHSHVDSAFARQLTKDLQNAGIEAWIDKEGIKPGEVWPQRIEEAIDACETMIVILSPDAVAPGYVRKEVRFAQERGRWIIPFMYKACDIPLELQGIQYVDLPKLGYDAALSSLVETLRAGPPTPVEEPAEPSEGSPPHVRTHVPGASMYFLAPAAIVVAACVLWWPWSFKPSRPIAIWFSPMGSESEFNYLADETKDAEADVGRALLGVFESLPFEPAEYDPDQVILNVKVGCYKTGDSSGGRLVIQVPTIRGCEVSGPYRRGDPNDRRCVVQNLAAGMRERILRKYPLRGEICRLPAGAQIPRGEPDAHISLGSYHGVYPGDTFKILDPNSLWRRRVGTLRVGKIHELESDANIVSGREEIHEHYLVEWTGRSGSE